MLLVYSHAISLLEVPNEISLCLNISECPCKCKGCSEPYLQESRGTPLTIEFLNRLLDKYKNYNLTCISFMGGDSDHIYLLDILKYVKDKNIKTPLLMSKGYIENMPNITSFFRNLTHNVYNIKGRNLTMKMEGVEHDISPGRTFITQYKIIERINQVLNDKNNPIQWILGKEGYYLIYDKGSIELSGNLVSFLGSNLIKTNANKYVLKYVDNSLYYSGDGFNNTLSDHLVNLTNNKEICNIYSSLIKGKNDNLLTSLEITDLTKNYKSINNLQIPINNIFDNIQINLRDSNNNNYDFNGVLYLMFSLGCKL